MEKYCAEAPPRQVGPPPLQHHTRSIITNQYPHIYLCIVYTRVLSAGVSVAIPVMFLVWRSIDVSALPLGACRPLKSGPISEPMRARGQSVAF